MTLVTRRKLGSVTKLAKEMEERASTKEKENKEIEVARVEPKGWVVRYQGKEWGPCAFLPPHDDSDRLKQIAEALEIPEEKYRDLARALWKPRITVQEPAPKPEPTEEIEEGVESEKQKRSQADRLILLCLAQEPELFHDQHKKNYAQVRQSDINLILPIRSRPFKSYLANLLWEAEEKAPSTEALYGAINVLEAKAFFDGDEHTLYNRVAPAEDGGIWIDMCDDRRRAIKVTAESWCIVNDPPILFKRYSHQQPLPEPKRGGDPWLLLDFINLKQDDESTRLVLLCTVISYLVPGIPHLILVLYGIQGSGKSMAFKLIRRVVDPSALDVLAIPRNERERVQQLDHNWCAFYDNVTRLPWWMSDTLCRASTGGGFTKRGLYTDDEDVIYQFRRCVGLNGINIAAQRGDLLDRALLVGLLNIPKDKRRSEKKLLADFKSRRPEILGGFLDVLVKAMGMYPSVKLKELFRMADFTKWGCVIAEGLGKEQKVFLDAYEAKVKAQIEEAAHASPLATVLMDYMETVLTETVLTERVFKRWVGTPSKLYTILTGHAKTLDISTRQKAWPKAPHVLVRQLNELAPSLKSLGWEVVTGARTGKARRISIDSSVTSVTTVTPQPTKDDTGDAGDAIPHISSWDVKDVKELVRVRDSQGKCVKCGSRGRMDWQVTLHNKEWGFLCGDCGFALQKSLGKIE